MIDLSRFRALYFFMFSGLGVIMPYLPVYFEFLKYSKSQIGVLSMIPNFSSFMVAPLFSIIGDKLDAHTEVSHIGCCFNSFSFLVMYQFDSFHVMHSLS